MLFKQNEVRKLAPIAMVMQFCGAGSEE